MERILKKKGHKWNNEYFDNGECIILRISKEETNESYDVFIDYEDFDKVSEGQWFVNIKRKNTDLKNIPYILWSKMKNGKKINYQLHQYILDTKYSDVVIDHINMNRFDNRRSNLRITTCQVNSINQVHVGYRYEKQHDRYLTRIKVDDKTVNIGRYKTEKEANEIYLKCCIILGKDKICKNIQDRIKENNIIITDDDYKNKYIQKILSIKEGNYTHEKYNGKFKAKPVIMKNIELIDELISKGYSFNKVGVYLKENNIHNKIIKGEIIKKYYFQYKNY